MKILLLGKNGQVGWELQRALAPLGQLVCLDRRNADLANAASVKAALLEYTPDIIVNAAAYTAVDKAESEVELANTINAKSVALIAEYAKKNNALFIHYSTDYVFDGTKDGLYTEEDAVNPLSVYGSSKLAGEKAIIASGCRYLVFRTSWVFAAKGNNFAKTMIRLATEREELNVVADQFGAPTSAELIADVTANAIIKSESSESSDFSGVYHLVAKGETCWHRYAQYVIEKAREKGVEIKCSSEAILPIPTEQFPVPATRPKNSRLNTTKLENKFDIVMPNWQVYVDRMLTEYLEK
jgi:dTDP-4-dehydrorhamnose reductase